MFGIIKLKDWLRNLPWRRKSGLLVDLSYQASEELLCMILARYILARRRRGLMGVSGQVQECIDQGKSVV